MLKMHYENQGMSDAAHGLPTRDRPIRFAILLFSLLLLVVAIGFATTSIGELLANIAASVVLFAGLASMYHNRILLVAALLLLIPALATRWVFFWLQASTLEPVSILFSLLFTAFNTGTLFFYIQRRGSPANDTIYGGICVYLLLGSCFAQAFVMLELLAPGSFYFMHGAPVGNSLLRNQLSYYSFITLATVGYGDITPLSPLAKSLAMIEAVTGPMFIAVFLARLVGVRTSNH